MKNQSISITDRALYTVRSGDDSACVSRQLVIVTSRKLINFLIFTFICNIIVSITNDGNYKIIIFVLAEQYYYYYYSMLKSAVEFFFPLSHLHVSGIIYYIFFPAIIIIGCSCYYDKIYGPVAKLAFVQFSGVLFCQI